MNAMPSVYEGREPHVDDSPMLGSGETETGDRTPAPHHDDVEDHPEDDEIVVDGDEDLDDDEPDDRKAPVTDDAPEVVDGDEDLEELDDSPNADQYQKFYEHLNTADGAFDFTVETLMALGYDLDEVEAILTRAPQQRTPAADATDDEDDDDSRVVTLADLKRLQQEDARRAEEAERQRQAQATAASLQKHVVTTVDGFRNGGEELSVEQKRMVVKLAEDHLSEADYENPAAITVALKKGLRDFKALVGPSSPERTQRKAATAKRVPKPVRGATGGSEGDPTDDASFDVKAGIARARKRLQASGTI